MAEARILVAEGNELAATALEEQLRSLGYEVLGIARTGDEVVEMLDQFRPDLLVLDMQLPGLTADLLVTRIDATAPVVMISSQVDARSVQQAEQAGVLAYLVKPINPEELPPAIDIALARYREIQHLRTQVDDLRDSLESHKIVERAKGILMRRLNISDQDAEARIIQRAKDRGGRVRDIAQAIVDSDALLS